MNKPIAIVTDSVACIPAGLVKQYDIAVVPIRLIIEQKEYRDGIDITPTEFYKILRQNNSVPTSAGAVPGAFVEAFQTAAEKTDRIFCITISRKFSGMYDAALKACDIVNDALPGVKIEIFDSGTAAAAQGLVVLAAARAAAAGKSMPEVTASTRSVASYVHLLGMLDTMKYLSRSGRVPRAVALAGSVLRIKPVFALQDGEVFPLANSRSISGGITRMIIHMSAGVVRERPIHAAIMHADAEEQAKVLHDRIANQFNCRELFITEFTPVIGAYAGPGVLALAYYASP